MSEQGDQPARDNTAGEVKASDAARRKARELGVDLDSVQGTGGGGRISVEDVERTPRQSDSTAGLTGALRAGGSPVPAAPTLEDIRRQYVVLKATLAGPNNGIALKITREDGSVEDITDQTFPDNPLNFFAPGPPINRWTFPPHQPLLPGPNELPGTNQPCREEACPSDHVIT